MKAVDLFAGPGGWDLPARDLGLEVVGVENDPAPIATRAAAGLRTSEADVARISAPASWIGLPVELLIASPPCPDFSESNRRNALGRAGRRGALVDEVLRWVRALEPRLVACEQVPTVLPVWQEFEVALRRRGYRTWSGIVDSADFGVPQNRRRAVLTARLDDGFLIPLATHAPAGEPSLLEAPAPWVTMAEALEGYGPVYVRLEEGAPYVEAPLPEWARLRPSTTVTSGGRVAAPGYRQHNERQFGKGAVRLTVEQAARLQGFPDGYPWQAPRVHQQIGNAVPPMLARAILGALLGAEQRTPTTHGKKEA